MRQCGFCDDVVHLLTANPARPVSAHVLPLSTNPLTTDIIATAPLVPQMTASTRDGETATVAVLAGMKTITAIRKNAEAHAPESHQPTHQPGEVRTGAAVTTTKRRRQNGAVTAPTDPTMIGAETKRRNIEATESAQSPPRSPLTVQADEAYQTRVLTSTATQKNTTKAHRNHRESGVPTTRTTTTIATSGNAPAATPTTRPKRKNPPVTTPPDPASAKPKNHDPTTTTTTTTTTGHPGS